MARVWAPDTHATTHAPPPCWHMLVNSRLMRQGQEPFGQSAQTTWGFQASKRPYHLTSRKVDRWWRQWIGSAGKGVTTESRDLSLVSRTHVVEGENQTTVSWPLTSIWACARPYIHHACICVIINKTSKKCGWRLMNDSLGWSLISCTSTHMYHTYMCLSIHKHTYVPSSQKTNKTKLYSLGTLDHTALWTWYYCFWLSTLLPLKLS